MNLNRAEISVHKVICFWITNDGQPIVKLKLIASGSWAQTTRPSCANIQKRHKQRSEWINQWSQLIQLKPVEYGQMKWNWNWAGLKPVQSGNETLILLSLLSLLSLVLFLVIIIAWNRNETDLHDLLLQGLLSVHGRDVSRRQFGTARRHQWTATRRRRIHF